ncbi:hypothetical protein KKH14_00550 [Patescibacteria group bacterium]|nr:hypothetical protein [Patescibacteria group bacterium]
MSINFNKQEITHLPEVIIEFNEDWEIDNWYDTVKKDPKFGLSGGKTKWGLGDIPSDVPDIIADITDENSAKEVLKKRLESELEKSERKELIKNEINKAKERWNNVAESYFNLLSDMIEIPIAQFEKQYFAYFTFSTRCPFFKNTFMFNSRLNFADNAIHEIMYIEFLKAYKEYCLKKGLNDNQIDHLKEILTVLLNDSMKGLLSRPDNGYTKHQELRVKALELYKNSKNFVEFLDKIITVIKLENYFNQ